MISQSAFALAIAAVAIGEAIKKDKHNRPYVDDYVLLSIGALVGIIALVEIIVSIIKPSNS